MVLKRVYEHLRDNGVVSSESEFSRDWLGRSECYLRSVRFNGAQPSISTVALCASKLQHYGERLSATEQHKRLGELMAELAEECHAHINNACRAQWRAVA
jgi:hypothetical protein